MKGKETRLAKEYQCGLLCNSILAIQWKTLIPHRPARSSEPGTRHEMQNRQLGRTYNKTHPPGSREVKTLLSTTQTNALNTVRDSERRSKVAEPFRRTTKYS